MLAVVAGLFLFGDLILHVSTFVAVYRVHELLVVIFAVFSALQFAMLGLAFIAVKFTSADAIPIRKWEWACALALFLYSFVSLGFLMSRPGDPRLEDGRYVLKQRTRIVRELTEPEYRKACIEQLRGASGASLLWAFIPFAVFTSIALDGRDERPTT